MNDAEEEEDEHAAQPETAEGLAGRSRTGGLHHEAQPEEHGEDGVELSLGEEGDGQPSHLVELGCRLVNVGDEIVEGAIEELHVHEQDAEQGETPGDVDGRYALARSGGREGRGCSWPGHLATAPRDRLAPAPTTRVAPHASSAGGRAYAAT